MRKVSTRQGFIRLATIAIFVMISYALFIWSAPMRLLLLHVSPRWALYLVLVGGVLLSILFIALFILSHKSEKPPTVIGTLFLLFGSLLYAATVYSSVTDYLAGSEYLSPIENLHGVSACAFAFGVFTIWGFISLQRLLHLRREQLAHAEP